MNIVLFSRGGIDMKEETRYIFSKGDLSRKDFSIQFKNEKGNVYLPIKDTKEIYCFNEITLSTKFLEMLSKAGVIVHFFGYYENLYRNLLSEGLFTQWKANSSTGYSLFSKRKTYAYS